MRSNTLRSAWLGTIAVGLLVLVLPQAHAAESSEIALAAALKNVPSTLEQGLKTSEKTGKPISAKFEIEEGKLQLSIYTITGDGFTEVLVAPDNGSVMKAEKITDEEDLKAAAAQKAAMEKAKMPLLAATEKAVGANAGARGVSIYPELKDGQPVAAITLVNDGKFTKVSEKLN
jgi:hypothetical protein